MNESVDRFANQHILITGGAGYIGSVLTGRLLQQGAWTTVMDELHFGGESLLSYASHPRFHFVLGDICDRERVIGSVREKIDCGAPPLTAAVHLAAIVGFPACQAASRDDVWRVNVHGVQNVFEAVEQLGAGRFLFSSTYSNYGLSEKGGPVTENSALNPQSLYAESKIAAEGYLHKVAAATSCAPLIFRFATLYGVSPRMRFDLIVNQFVLEAFCRGELLIYQQGYARSFIHIEDVIDGILLGLKAPLDWIRGQIFNVGSETGNRTKEEIVQFIRRALPNTRVRYKDLIFEGDMRDIRMSFAKIREVLGFEASRDVESGIQEVLKLLQSGLIQDPFADRYRNAEFIVQ